MKPKIVVAITGASGSIYAKVLLDKLLLYKDQIDRVAIVMSKNAKDVWEFELGTKSYQDYPFENFEKDDFMAPFASGSAQFKNMIVAPCSMGSLARIAAGTSDDLICRAADVILKERRQLILVTRESPLNLIHINNMKTLTEAGAMILPATPSFYSRPKTFEELALTVIDRAIDAIGIEQDTKRWQS
jgi:4-hydroxy-3-polyprenylbenzoate decarboxylase